MKTKIQNTKARLLELGYLDNRYLVDYLNLLEANLTTMRSRTSTQAHHAIPVNDYWTSTDPYDRLEALKLAHKDPFNFEVNLLYKDHLLAHALLTLCTNLTVVQQKYEQQKDLRKQNSKIAANSASKNELVMQMPRFITEEKILAKLAQYEAALNLATQESDVKAEHHYRSLVAQWKSKYRQYLADPEKYTHKKTLSTINFNTTKCHENAIKRKELRQKINQLHENYRNLCATFSSMYYAKKDAQVKEAYLQWRQAVEEYNNFYPK